MKFKKIIASFLASAIALTNLSQTYVLSVDSKAEQEADSPTNKSIYVMPNESGYMYSAEYTYTSEMLSNAENSALSAIIEHKDDSDLWLVALDLFTKNNGLDISLEEIYAKLFNCDTYDDKQMDSVVDTFLNIYLHYNFPEEVDAESYSELYYVNSFLHEVDNVVSDFDELVSIGRSALKQIYSTIFSGFGYAEIISDNDVLEIIDSFYNNYDTLVEIVETESKVSELVFNSVNVMIIRKCFLKDLIEISPEGSMIRARLEKKLDESKKESIEKFVKKMIESSGKIIASILAKNNIIKGGYFKFIYTALRVVVIEWIKANNIATAESYIQAQYSYDIAISYHLALSDYDGSDINKFKLLFNAYVSSLDAVLYYCGKISSDDTSYKIDEYRKWIRYNESNLFDFYYKELSERCSGNINPDIPYTYSTPYTYWGNGIKNLEIYPDGFKIDDNPRIKFIANLSVDVRTIKNVYFIKDEKNSSFIQKFAFHTAGGWDPDNYNLNMNIYFDNDIKIKDIEFHTYAKQVFLNGKTTNSTSKALITDKINIKGNITVQPSLELTVDKIIYMDLINDIYRTRSNITNNGRLIINGDFDLWACWYYQKLNDDSYLLVKGNFRGRHNPIQNAYMYDGFEDYHISKGIVEFKGDVNLFASGNESKTIFSGNKKQYLDVCSIGNCENLNKEGLDFERAELHGDFINNGGDITGTIKIYPNGWVSENVYCDFIIVGSVNKNMILNGNVDFDLYQDEYSIIKNGVTLTVNGDINDSAPFEIDNGGRLVLNGDFNSSSYLYALENSYVTISGNTNGPIYAYDDSEIVLKGDVETFYNNTTAKLILAGDKQQVCKSSISCHYLEIRNYSDEGVIFSYNVSVKTLFNHNQCNFEIKDNNYTYFVDYDGDGLKDNVDPYPMSFYSDEYAPTNLTATYGDNLTSVILPENLYGTWKWKSDESVGNVGLNYFTAVFTCANEDLKPVEVRLAVNVMPKTITLRAKHKTIIVNSQIPAEYEYEVIGLLDNDALIQKPLFQCNIDITQIGSYNITPYNADAGSNYKILYEDGICSVCSLVDSDNVTTNIVNNADNLNLILSDEDKTNIISSIEFTDEELNKYYNGAEIKITFVIEDVGDPENNDDIVEIKRVCGDYSIGQYFNLNLNKIITENGITITTPIEETLDNVTLSIEIPESLKPDDTFNRNYSIIRVHNGIASIINNLSNDKNLIIFETNKFSTFSIIYKDEVLIPGDSESDNESGSSTSTEETTNTSVDEPPVEETTDTSGGESSTEETTDTSGGEPPVEETTDTSVGEPPVEETTDTSGSEPPTEEITDTSGGEPPVEEATDTSGSEPPVEETTDTSVDEPPVEETTDTSVDEPPVEEITNISETPSNPATEIGSGAFVIPDTTELATAESSTETSAPSPETTAVQVSADNTDTISNGTAQESASDISTAPSDNNTDGNTGGNTRSTDSTENTAANEDKNQNTGVTLAVIPVLAAAAGIIFSKKRK